MSITATSLTMQFPKSTEWNYCQQKIMAIENLQRMQSEKDYKKNKELDQL